MHQVHSNLNQNGGQKIHKETGVTLQKNAKLPIKKQKAKLKNDALYLIADIFESVTSPTPTKLSDRQVEQGVQKSNLN